MMLNEQIHALERSLNDLRGHHLALLELSVTIRELREHIENHRVVEWEKEAQAGYILGLQQEVNDLSAAYSKALAERDALREAIQEMRNREIEAEEAEERTERAAERLRDLAATSDSSAAEDVASEVAEDQEARAQVPSLRIYHAPTGALLLEIL